MKKSNDSTASQATRGRLTLIGSINPWDRLRNESAKAYAAFVAYRDAGADRSVIGAYRQTKGHPKATQPARLWKAWARDHLWEERAAAYDAHLAAVAQQARETEIARRAAEMERRRAQAQDDAWALFEQVKDRAKQMLKLPIVTVADEDGKKVINPAKWDYNSIARTIEAMTKLAKLGAGLDSGLLTALTIDWASLTEDQLERIAAGENPARVIASARLDRSA